ncbi:MAG: TRAP transporter small permease [Lachnospiraceae bacterium]|jgi:C4-dicarboxylate transporter DctQ subunit|nr:TRAP transporter small permease [Lachnospiraceae bacterium]
MSILEGLKKVMGFIVVIIMMAMVVVIFLATFGRYTGVFSIPWSEEFARYCMVSMVYLASMLAAAKGAHFCVEIADVILPKTILKIVKVFNIIAVDLFSLFILKQGWGISSKMLNQGKLSPMLELPLGAVYMVIPIGLILMAIYFTIYNIQKIKEISNAQGKEDK